MRSLQDFASMLGDDKPKPSADLALMNEEPKINEEPRISVAQLIAPQYSEAMQLALKDVDAASISQQCGITRAEAELVAALVRNRDN